MVNQSHSGSIGPVTWALWSGYYMYQSKLKENVHDLLVRSHKLYRILQLVLLPTVKLIDYPALTCDISLLLDDQMPTIYI